MVPAAKTATRHASAARGQMLICSPEPNSDGTSNINPAADMDIPARLITNIHVFFIVRTSPEAVGDGGDRCSADSCVCADTGNIPPARPGDRAPTCAGTRDVPCPLPPPIGRGTGTVQSCPVTSSPSFHTAATCGTPGR
ncbi:hypothetical protein GCM10007147_40730 [Nocardiopsis kunsanensis]|uniref:Uncharacterized protein n=1 Tax=Nocardiopsis kunsanensis TaxID=141693 RepID=A0A918XJM1_9ACTN|nr:hypothetical protein GCM10007147_40730 [Nocardiopsis kunsanensis]